MFGSLFYRPELARLNWNMNHIWPAPSLSLQTVCTQNVPAHGVAAAERSLIQFYQLTVPHFTVSHLYLSSEHSAHQTEIYVKFLSNICQNDRIPVGGEILRTRPDRPWGPPNLLYNGYRVFPGGKAAGAWCWPPKPHLAPRLNEEYKHTYNPPLGLRGLF